MRAEMSIRLTRLDTSRHFTERLALRLGLSDVHTHTWVCHCMLSILKRWLFVCFLVFYLNCYKSKATLFPQSSKGRFPCHRQPVLSNQPFFVFFFFHSGVIVKPFYSLQTCFFCFEVGGRRETGGGRGAGGHLQTALVYICDRSAAIILRQSSQTVIHISTALTNASRLPPFSRQFNWKPRDSMTSY